MWCFNFFYVHLYVHKYTFPSVDGLMWCLTSCCYIAHILAYMRILDNLFIRTCQFAIVKRFLRPVMTKIFVCTMFYWLKTFLTSISSYCCQNKCSSYLYPNKSLGWYLEIMILLLSVPSVGWGTSGTGTLRYLPV